MFTAMQIAPTVIRIFYMLLEEQMRKVIRFADFFHILYMITQEKNSAFLKHT